MKLIKSVLSASILAAAVSTATAADGFDIYGKVSVMHDNSTSQNINNAISRLGFTFSNEINGYTFGATHEIGFAGGDNNFKTLQFGHDEARQSHLDLSGDFGSLSMGRIYGVAYNAVGSLADQFTWHSGYDMVTDVRESDTLAYTSPDFNGVTISASTSYSGTDNTEIGLVYKMNDSITLSAMHGSGDAANNADEDQGVGLVYSADALTIKASYQESDESNAEYTNIYAGYSVDDKTYLAANIGDEKTSSTDNNPYTLGAYFTYMDGLTFWAEYYDTDTTAGTTYTTFGLNYDF